LLKLLGLAETATEADVIAAVNKLIGIVANKGVFAVLGLPETATEAEVIAMVNKLKSGSVVVVANKAVLTALGLPETATEAEVTGTIMAMKQSHDQVGGLAQTVKDLKDKLTLKDATEVVALAMKEGKITPAQKDWADKYAKDDLEGFKVFVAKAPVVVVMGRVVNEDKHVEGALDETQVSINKMMGVDEETYKKYDK